jgi:uncharacterized membrane protein
MDYLTLKYIHIVSSTIFFGTGIGSAFYMFMANRSKNIVGIHLVVRQVVIADWLFTAPSVVIQFITGIALMRMGNYALTDVWIMFGIVLYFFAAACWLPVVWLQIKMRDMAKEAMDSNSALPARYWRYDKIWISLGSLAFAAVMVIFYLMVVKVG